MLPVTRLLLAFFTVLSFLAPSVAAAQKATHITPRLVAQGPAPAAGGGSRVVLGGRCVTVIEGTFLLP